MFERTGAFDELHAGEETEGHPGGGCQFEAASQSHHLSEERFTDRAILPLSRKQASA
jgi:hypothetical protein